MAVYPFSNIQAAYKIFSNKIESLEKNLQNLLNDH